jgi:adenosine deaminase
MNDNYKAVVNALKLQKEDILTLARNGIEASFLKDDEKQVLIGKLNDFARK